VRSAVVSPRPEPDVSNPILPEAAWDRECPPIPWLGGLRVAFEYP
jgi:hypothetical protein